MAAIDGVFICTFCWLAVISSGGTSTDVTVQQDGGRQCNCWGSLCRLIGV